MQVTIVLDSGEWFDFDHVDTCGVMDHYDGVHKKRRLFFINWRDIEHDVLLSKDFPMSRVREFWCEPTI